jgi:hypothetical protein
MLKKLFKAVTARADKSGHRLISSPDQLDVNDILTFKYREDIPASLRDESLSVEAISAYEYESGVYKELTLKDSHGDTFYMSFDGDEGLQTLCLSLKIARKTVFTLFDAGEFSELFGEAQVDLDTKGDVVEYAGWYAPHYTQTIKNAEAYFYACDPDKLDLMTTDNAKELMYHECESDDEKFALTIEVWPDGETDVFLQVMVGADALAEIYPYAG